MNSDVVFIVTSLEMKLVMHARLDGHTSKLVFKTGFQKGFDLHANKFSCPNKDFYIAVISSPSHVRCTFDTTVSHLYVNDSFTRKDEAETKCAIFVRILPRVEAGIFET